jgi:hypothetical protein
LSVREDEGTVSVAEGSATVEGSGTNWGSGLTGQTFEVAADRTQYTIARVDSPTRLALDRAYEGSTAAGRSYAIIEKETYAVASVDSPTQIRLDRPYSGATKSDRDYAVSIGGFRTNGGAGDAPSLPRQYPLDLVLLSTLHPALAQIIGLYWVDQKAAPGVSHDYLLVADYQGLGALNEQKILEVVRQDGFGLLDGYIVFGKRTQSAPALPPPGDPRVYALPGGAPGDASETPTVAGLRWNLQRVAGELVPEGAIMYHLWRANLGDHEPRSAPLAGAYRLLTQDRPLLVAEPQLPPGATPQRPAQWPEFPMHAIDGHL